MSQLRPGDCLIDFSVKKLYGLREKINMKNEVPKGETSIIYGKLPPKTRKSQANLFNAQDLPYLVASNAIGMGLNLSINRVIFTNLYKTTKLGRKQI
jgi:ATP-dependent RNA helicase SUPV3L1/SUV3